MIPSYCDMASGLFRYAGAERMGLLVARVQLISEYYGCPSGVHGGKTDSCFVDVQCGIEKAMSAAFPVLAGAVGIGTVGHLENALTFSPQQLVIDNEIIAHLRHTLKPIQVNEETLALNTIREVGPEGNYLAEAHTASHFRNELFLSNLFECVPWATAHSQDTKGMQQKAWEAAHDIWKETPEPILDSDQIAAIDQVVAHAERTILK